LRDAPVEVPGLDTEPLTLAEPSEPIVRMRVLTDQVDLSRIEELDFDQLVRLLASVQPGVPQAAALALRAKNMPDDRLALASELATSSPQRRISLIQQIAIRDDLDPRPWLLWMAEDGEPEVRKQAITSLASMTDLTVQRELRQLLNNEQNEDVAQSIRQVLVTRSPSSLR
jgi:hypothetical protein